MNKIRRRVMVRVYTVFAARLITHPIVVYSALFGAGLVTFAQMVHVRSVIENFLSIPVAGIPTFVTNAVLQGEVLTLAAIGIMVFSALSIQWRVRMLVAPRLQGV